MELGWREWVALPELGIPAVKAKVDTGARTSALHAFYIETEEREGRTWLRFGLHPLQGSTERAIHTAAPLQDQRVVTDSGGHAEERYVIETPVRLGGRLWPIELTLTSRETMRFRMLLGRQAMTAQGLTVNPARSYAAGEELARAYDEED